MQFLFAFHISLAIKEKMAEARRGVKLLGHIDALSFSPTTGQLAVAVSQLTGSSWTGRLQLVDASVGGIEQTVETAAGLPDLAWVGATRESVATATDAGTVLLWQKGAESGLMEQVACMEDHDDIVSTLAAELERPNEVVSGSFDHELKHWDLQRTDLPTRTLTGHFDAVNDADWGPDQSLLSCSQDGTLRLWDLRIPGGASSGGSGGGGGGAVGATVAVIKEAATALSVGWCPGGQAGAPWTYAAGFEDGSVALYDARRGALGRMETLTSPGSAHDGGVHTLAFRPQPASLQLATGSDDTTACVHAIDAALDSHLAVRHRAHLDYVRGLAWSADGATLVSGGWDGQLWLWPGA